MSLSNFHPITVFHLTCLPFIIKCAAWVTFQLADGVAYWSLYGTLALTCHLWFNTSPIKQEEVGPRLAQVGTSDFNHVSNYNDNGAAAIFSAALPTFDISVGKGRRSLSNENTPIRGSSAFSWNEMNPLPIIAVGERVGVRRPLQHIRGCASESLQRPIQPDSSEDKMRCRLNVWATLGQLWLLKGDTLTEKKTGEKADLLPWKLLCRSFRCIRLTLLPPNG